MSIPAWRIRDWVDQFPPNWRVDVQDNVLTIKGDSGHVISTLPLGPPPAQREQTKESA